MLILAVFLSAFTACANSPETLGIGSESVAGLPVPSITGALGGISVKAPPVAAYTKFARQIRRCWLAGDNSPLGRLKFYAKASNGAEQKADIQLLHMLEGAKRGVPAYSIQLLKSGEGAAAYIENHRLNEDVAARLRQDLERWAQGDVACEYSGATAWAANFNPAPNPPAKAKK